MQNTIDFFHSHKTRLRIETMARSGKTAKMTEEQCQQHAQSLKQGNVPEQPIAMAQATVVEETKVTKESHVLTLTTYEDEGNPTKCGETFFTTSFRISMRKMMSTRHILVILLKRGFAFNALASHQADINACIAKR